MSQISFMTIKRKVPLNPRSKLASRTTPEIKAAVGRLLARLNSEGLRFLDRSLGAEGLIGAIMLEFLNAPAAQQDDVLRRRLPELEDMIWHGQLSKGTPFVVMPDPPAADQKRDGPLDGPPLPRGPRAGYPNPKQGGSSSRETG